MDSSCIKCSKGTRNEPLVRCGGLCGKGIHEKCSGLSKYDIDKLQSNVNIKFVCDHCIGSMAVLKENYSNILASINSTKDLFKQIFEQSVEKMEKSVSEIINKNNVNNLKKCVKEAVSEVKESESKKEKKSYASMLRAPIYIKPKKHQESEKTIKEVKDKINPSKLSVKVNKITNKRDGAVTIQCENEKERSIISKEIIEKLNDNYDIKVSDMRNPKVLIHGMREQLKEEQVEMALKAQNKAINFKEIKCLKVFQSAKNKNIYNAIVDVDGEAFANLMKIKNVYIEWDECICYENINVKRCFKCCGFNHSAANCKSEKEICAKCGENHITKECKSECLRCINCVLMKERLNNIENNIDVNHDSRDANCPVLQRKLKIEREKIKY